MIVDELIAHLERLSDDGFGRHEAQVEGHVGELSDIESVEVCDDEVFIITDHL